MNVGELIEMLRQCDEDAEVMIRVETWDYTILGFEKDFNGQPTLLALEAGK